MFNKTEVIEHSVIGATMLATLLWLDVFPAAVLGECVKALVVWSACSTLLIASLGAWVALGRYRRPQGRPLT